MAFGMTRLPRQRRASGKIASYTTVCIDLHYENDTSV